MLAVCERVAKGELVRHASKAEGITEQRVRELGLTDKYSSLYARARESQAHALAEQALEIADGSDALTLLYERGIEAFADENPEAVKVVNSLRANAINRDRMRMDARKWLTSKIAPRLYGDKLQVEGTEDGPPVKVAVTHKVIDPHP